MKLKKIISGGQTGADRTGLECAKELGIPTGGMAPRGYLTETGPDPSLKDFGLVEHFDTSYVPRTRQNAHDGDVTVWFGKVGSPGYYCTRKACKDHGKDYVENPPDLLLLADMYEIINIAGNRKSKNPGVVDLVKAAFAPLKEVKRKDWAYGCGPGTLAGNEDL